MRNRKITFLTPKNNKAYLIRLCNNLQIEFNNILLIKVELIRKTHFYFNGILKGSFGDTVNYTIVTQEKDFQITIPN